MAVAEAFLRRPARLSAGAGDGDAGEGSAPWGRGRPVGPRPEGGRGGLVSEPPGPAAGLREPPCSSPGLLITPCAAASLTEASLESFPPSFSGVDQVQEPASTSPRGVPGEHVRLPVPGTGCSSRALGPSYVTGENPSPGGSVALKSGWTPLFGSRCRASAGVGAWGAGGVWGCWEPKKLSFPLWIAARAGPSPLR